MGAQPLIRGLEAELGPAWICVHLCHGCLRFGAGPDEMCEESVATRQLPKRLSAGRTCTKAPWRRPDLCEADLRAGAAFGRARASGDNELTDWRGVSRTGSRSRSGESALREP